MTNGLDMPPVLRDVLKRRLLFFARPQVASMIVRSTDLEEWGSVVSNVRSGDPLSIFLAVFVGEHDGFGYKAKDRNGRVVEQGAT